jgi:predicted DCC family thiol-disulfide oxidoreductase YuxK
MPESVFRAAWIVMAVGYTYSGLTKLASPSWLDGSALRHVLENPLARPGALRDLLLALPAPALGVLTWGTLALEIAFAPLSLAARARRWLWAAMLALHLGLIALVDFADLSLGMVMLHLFTFDPAWVPGRRRADDAPDLVFYDGACGLCHGTVRFLAAEDGGGRAFRFAPLGGARFRAALSERARAALPDSLVVLTSDERVFTRSDAVAHLLGRLGGLWRVVGGALSLCPRPWRDLGYDLAAAARRRLAAPVGVACPVLPPFLRARFEA